MGADVSWSYCIVKLQLKGFAHLKYIDVLQRGERSALWLDLMYLWSMLYVIYCSMYVCRMLPNVRHNSQFSESLSKLERLIL